MPLSARSPLGSPMKAKPGQVLISSPKDLTGRAFSAADVSARQAIRPHCVSFWVRRQQNARVASATGNKKLTRVFWSYVFLKGVFGAGPGCHVCPDGGGGRPSPVPSGRICSRADRLTMTRWNGVTVEAHKLKCAIIAPSHYVRYDRVTVSSWPVHAGKTVARPDRRTRYSGDPSALVPTDETKKPAQRFSAIGR